MGSDRVTRYLDFVAATGAKLHPGQRVVASVAFDGVEPGELEGEERELARQMFGDVETIPRLARGVFVAVCGARGGKSRFLCGTRAVHLAATVDVDGLAPGETAYALIVGDRLALARQTLAFALAAAKTHPDIAPHIVDESADGFSLRRKGGRAVRLECAAASRGGAAGRGRSLVGAIMDEAAFFRDSSFVVCDDEVYKALSPRIIPGGQLIIASTPWAESGLLYDFWSKNWGSPATALVAHAPTLLLNPDKADERERERLRDPDNAAREFDAEFMAGGATEFFDAATLRESSQLEQMTHGQLGRARIAAGIDLGFVRDSSAIAVVTAVDGRYDLLDWREVKPAKGEPLVPSEVCHTFNAVLARRKARVAWGDGYYFLSAREHLRVPTRQAPGGAPGKAETHLLVRDLLREGRIRIPPTARSLLRQLQEITATPSPGGNLKITAPRSPRGGHGDLASAFVLAVWGAAQAGSASFAAYA